MCDIHVNCTQIVKPKKEHITAVVMETFRMSTSSVFYK